MCARSAPAPNFQGIAVMQTSVPLKALGTSSESISSRDGDCMHGCGEEVCVCGAVVGANRQVHCSVVLLNGSHTRRQRAWAVDANEFNITLHIYSPYKMYPSHHSCPPGFLPCIAAWRCRSASASPPAMLPLLSHGPASLALPEYPLSRDSGAGFLPAGRLAGGLAEALRQRQAAMQGRKPGGQEW
jgi:hypothetical protein